MSFNRGAFDYYYDRLGYRKDDYEQSKQMVKQQISEDSDYVFAHFEELFHFSLRDYIEMAERYEAYRDRPAASGPEIYGEEREKFSKYKKIYQLLGHDLDDRFQRMYNSIMKDPLPPQIRLPARPDSGDCPICYESLLGQPVIKCPVCKNQFHVHCVNVFCNDANPENRACPMCRSHWPMRCEGMHHTFERGRTPRERTGGRKRKRTKKFKKLKGY